MAARITCCTSGLNACLLSRNHCCSICNVGKLPPSNLSCHGCPHHMLHKRSQCLLVISEPLLLHMQCWQVASQQSLLPWLPASHAAQAVSMPACYLGTIAAPYAMLASCLPAISPAMAARITCCTSGLNACLLSRNHC